jgi:23S rRNA (guanine745-N1)-methyltransferase
VPVADVADLLACPVCAARSDPDVPLTPVGRSLRCPAGHAFDLARQGYLNLAGRAEPQHADTVAMVAARERFLESGAYDPVADAVLRAARGLRDGGAVLEAGAGPGWYLARLLAGLAADGVGARGLALDISVAACRRAAVRTAGSPVGVLVADVWGPLPIQSGTVEAVLSVFAPRNAAEFARVLAPGGRLVVVSPLPDHLAGLRAAWGLLDVEPGKQERLASVLAEHLVPAGANQVRFAVEPAPALLADLVAMGPNAFHATGPGPAEPAPALPSVEAAVQVAVWRRPG